MSLKNRLARLGSPGGGAPGRGALVGRPEGEAPPDAAPIDPGRGSVLDELRAKMAALLDTPSAPLAPVPVRPADSELPFLRVEGPAGAFHRRLQVLAPSHHVGRIPVDAARTASSAMLGLLALDPALRDVDLGRALYLDTETTGLGGAGAVAFLVGLAWFDEAGQLVLEQLFLDRPSDEAALLAVIEERLAAASCVVSYNGKSFDLPLLDQRAVMTRRPSLPRRPHLDLLHVGRRLHKARLGACRLIHLESEVLGWDRGEDDVPGAEIPPRYMHYLRTGDGSGLLPVIDHNAWDVVTMAALVGLYGEPIGLLHHEDLLGAAETARRGKAYDEARDFANASRERGGGPEALRMRARIEKARGDRARALADFEEFCQAVDDAAARLELVKLYEHHARDFEAALRVLAAGTGEEEEAVSKRSRRLAEKALQKAEPRASARRKSR